MGLVTVRPLLAVLLLGYAQIVHSDLQAHSQSLGQHQLVLSNEQQQEHVFVLRSDQLTIVHFWASWCGPCREELPSLNQFMQRFQPQGVRLVSIAADSHVKVRRFLQQTAVPGKILIDQYGRALRLFGVRGMPSSYILDRNGQVIYRAQAAVDWQDERVIEKIQRLLDP